MKALETSLTEHNVIKSVFAAKTGPDFYYLYQNHADDDEANGHVIGAGYTFKF